uniref:Calponin-homology (CH) domain-containing protein n=1 Tax=Panagrellus redivivus TaxID=6233 RepID=A0A7E4VCF1_PANRE
MLTYAMKTPMALRFFFDATMAHKTMMAAVRSLSTSTDNDDFNVLFKVNCAYISVVNAQDPDRFTGLTHHGRPQTDYEALVRLVSVFVESELGVPLSKIDGWRMRSSHFGQCTHDDNQLLFLSLYIANAASTHPAFKRANLRSFSVDDFPACPEKSQFTQLVQWMYKLSEHYGGYNFATAFDEDKENASPAQTKSDLDSSLMNPRSIEASIIFEDIPDDVRLADMDLEFADEKLMRRVNELEMDNNVLRSNVVTKEERIASLEKDIKNKVGQVDNYHRMKVFAEDRARQSESKLKQVERESEAAKADATAARAEADAAKAELAALQIEFQNRQDELDELKSRYEAALKELELAKTVVDDVRRQQQQNPGGDAQTSEVILLRERISTYESRIASLTETIDEARQYPELVQQLEDDNAELARQVDVLTRDVEACEYRISELEYDVSQAEVRADQAESRVLVVEKALATATAEAEDLRAQNQQMLKQIQSQTADINQMRQRIDDDDEYVTKITEANRELSVTVSQQEDAAKRMTSEHEKLKVQYSRIMDDTANAATEVKSLQMNVEKLNAELKNKTAESDRLQAECDDLRGQASDFHRSFTNKNAERHQLEEALVARQTELEGLYDKIGKAESKLEIERDRADELRACLEKTIEEKKLLEKEIAALTGDQIRLLADKERLVKALENVQNDVDSKVALLADSDKRIEDLSAAIRGFKSMARAFDDDLSSLRTEVADMGDLMTELTSSIMPSLMQLRQSWIDMHETMDTSRRYNLSLEEELNELRKQQSSRTPSLQDEFSELGFPFGQESLVFDEEHHSDPDSGHATAISSPEVTPRDPVPAETADETHDVDIEKEDEVVETPVVMNQTQRSRSGFPVGSFLTLFLLAIVIVVVFQLDLAKIARFFRVKYEVFGRVPT